MNSAEVGAAAEVAMEAAEVNSVTVTSIVIVAGNTVTQVVSACQERAAKVAKTNDKKISSNVEPVVQFGLCKYVTCESANAGNGLSGTCSIIVNSVTQVINADRVMDKVSTDMKPQEKPQLAVAKAVTGSYMVKTGTYKCVCECYKPSKAWFRDIFELIKGDLCAKAKNVVTSQSDSTLVNRFTQAQRTYVICALVSNTDSPWNHRHYNTAAAAIDWIRRFGCDCVKTYFQVWSKATRGTHVEAFKSMHFIWRPPKGCRWFKFSKPKSMK